MRRQSKVPEVDVKNSSLFDFQRPPVRDRGESVISLADAPSLVRRGAKVQYENTYKMEPDGRVNYVAIKEIINSTLSEIFKDVSYHHSNDIGTLCKRASQTIKDRVKALKYHRYKIVCHVSVTQQGGQGIKNACRFLWDDKKDNWVDGIFANSNIVVHATVYALYYE